MKNKTYFTIKSIVTIFFVTVFMGCQSKPKKTFTINDIKVIPKPTTLTLEEGSFSFNKNTKVYVTNDAQLQAAGILLNRLKIAASLDLEVVKMPPSSNFIQFKLNEDLQNEAYQLNVNSKSITVEANSFSGFIYGSETLRQLLPAEIESQNNIESVAWVIPNVNITDSPRFKWRGLMLDLSRHFFEKDYIKQTIDRLAYLKMNTLHLHLVDDQGWRIEIKQYPKLTEVGSFRVNQEDKPWNARHTPKPEEKGTYGGFLTQEDIKDIVAYAQSRGVTVVPEIEMPAHVTSAIASYPELSCLEKPVAVPSGGLWPITDIFCAGKESTFEFLENVLTEVMGLFPSKYIHVGGDEATKTNWKTCKHCQKRMKTEGLENVEELQSYFIKRMERFISYKGRVLIGWDEILEGGLAPGAAVMSWRGVKGGLEASAEGHDVVMTPGSHCYFDHYQGDMDTEPKAWGGYTPISKVYDFDPVVESMTEKQAHHVLGGQANLWAEYVSTTSHSEYMIFPRLVALSETLWSPKADRTWEEFTTRLTPMFKRLEYQGINYAKSAYNISAETHVNNNTNVISVTLKNEFPNPDIRYTLDGTDVDNMAISYQTPIEITKTTTIKASLYENNKPIGKVFEKTFNYHKGVGKPVNYITKYSNSYQGAGTNNMNNIVRGSKNFHDGQWQAWIGNDMELVIDLEKTTEVSKVSVGSMENQGPAIYFPTHLEVLLSNDGKKFNSVGKINRPFNSNAEIVLKDFTIAFEKRTSRYVKVIAKSLKKTPNGGGAWLFVDEITIE
ncbi:beta-N-acetylhexosaminidase [Aestuariivivens marinum]|uniref:beta-N-acetylhexosaminidase n=1 Tax=Aestuariivivens marinum TaxID=2913555 RepID=UPI001F5A3D05|nr:glycoside hydrolase family 20 protein [Aestuariivivens marinum]